MENYNTCFDYDIMGTTAQDLKKASEDTNFTSMADDIADKVSLLEGYDKTHSVMNKQIDNLSEFETSFRKYEEQLEKLYTSIEESVKIFKNAEYDITEKLDKFAEIIEDEKYLGNSVVAGYIKDGTVNENTFTDDSETFLVGAAEYVKDYISQYAMFADKNCPENYASSEEWREALIEKYQEMGYSSYDARDLADLEMATWRVKQTGAEITTEAVSEAVSELAFITDEATGEDLSLGALTDKVSKEYETLVTKYKEYGLTEEQAQELATAESEYTDAKAVADKVTSTSGDYRAISTAHDKKIAWEELKEQYGISDTKDQTPPDDPGGGDDSDGDTGGTGGDNGGDYPEDNDGSSSTQARVETPSPNPSPSDTPNKVEKPTTDPTPEETPSDNTDTPSDNTGDNSNTGTDPETPSTGDDNNNTNTGNDSNNTKPDGGNNSNNNTGGNTNTGSGSNTNHGNTSRPSENTGNNSGYYVPGNNNGGGTSSTPPTTPSAGENGNAATTTPSAPDSDAGIIDNSGEELDVISIDKGSSAKPSTSSNDGGSVIPAILGVGVAGAAGVAGVKYIKNKKEKDNEYEDDSINEDENSFSYIGDYQENTDTSNDSYNAMPTGEKYKAGNVNKLVLDDAPENIKIEESMNDTTNQKEELE